MSQQLPLFSSNQPATITEVKATAQAKPWHHLPFLCVDVETTGLDPTSNRVIEVAWIMFEKEEEVFSDSRFMLSRHATSLTDNRPNRHKR